MTRYKEFAITLIVCAIMTLGLLGGCGYLNQMLGLQDDNLIEEAVEELIKAKTELTIDLTPESQE